MLWKLKSLLPVKKKKFIYAPPPTSVQSQWAPFLPDDTGIKKSKKQDDDATTTLEQKTKRSSQKQKKKENNNNNNKKKETKVVRFVCISDTHHMHEKLGVLPDGDVLILSGDLTFKAYTDLDLGIQQLRDLNEYLGQQSHRHKIVIAGNHDQCCVMLGQEKVQQILTNATYLEESLIEIEGLRIFTDPVSLQNFGWSPNSAYQIPRNSEQVKTKYEKLIEKFEENSIDIIVTHGPPYQRCDKNWGWQEQGCKHLRKFVDHVKPKYHVFGHLHEAFGVEQTEDTTFINASSCNMGNWIEYTPIVFDYVLLDANDDDDENVDN
jgi:Icc-related predicted phosphoesterase